MKNSHTFINQLKDNKIRNNTILVESWEYLKSFDIFMHEMKRELQKEILLFSLPKTQLMIGSVLENFSVCFLIFTLYLVCEEFMPENRFLNSHLIALGRRQHKKISNTLHLEIISNSHLSIHCCFSTFSYPQSCYLLVLDILNSSVLY